VFRRSGTPFPLVSSQGTEILVAAVSAGSFANGWRNALGLMDTLDWRCLSIDR
jgi:hypothetical protein